jgi:aminoglycoside phosphotransferase (APT) family kinase protein
VIVTADVPPGVLLDDRDRVAAFWRDDLGRTDVPTTIDFLTGGVSSLVVRVVTDDGAFVIKQALPQLRVEAAWFSRPERSGIEARCALALSELLPGSVPEVVAIVPERSAFVMRSAPPGTETWKDHLLRGEISLDVAKAVGRMLGRIHANSAGRADLAVEFADKSFFDELRIDPYLRYVAATAPDLAPVLDEVAAELLAAGACLVHGDFSPKNLLVTPDGDVLLVDHEVAHWGHPAFDVAFVTNHVCLKAVRLRAGGLALACLDAATAMLDAYAAEAGALQLGVGLFAARTTGALMLARVDGKSPVEYLTDERDRALVRSIGRDVLLNPPSDPWGVLARVREATDVG